VIVRRRAVVAYPCHSSRATRNAATQWHTRAEQPSTNFDPVLPVIPPSPAQAWRFMPGLQHGIEEEPGVLQCRRELHGAVAPDSWKNCGIDLCGRLDQDATELVLSDNAAA
jgi:hypothetical protein